MFIPYVIDNQTHKMRQVLANLLKQHEGRCLDIATPISMSGAEDSAIAPNAASLLQGASQYKMPLTRYCSSVTGCRMMTPSTSKDALQRCCELPECRGG